MAVIIRKDKTTKIVDSIEEAKEKAQDGEIIVYKGKAYIKPQYEEYNQLLKYFNKARAETRSNTDRLKRLRDLTTEILIWEAI